MASHISADTRQFRSKTVQVIAAYSRPNYFATTVTVTAVAKEKTEHTVHFLRSNIAFTIFANIRFVKILYFCHRQTKVIELCPVTRTLLTDI
jgi:uncharacterized OsmC-like protein